VAPDGHQGLAKAAEFRPQVILCDIGLAGEMNGYQVAQKLRQGNHSEAYLVAVTGYGQEEDRRAAKAAGFDYHLTKPVSRDQLQEVMTKMPRF
jgi:CheY-like chemotaxis protein